MVRNSRREDSPDQYATLSFFGTGPEHSKHAQSARIIYLEESSQILCPLCLETFSYKELHRFGDELYNQFVRNLLEALDQNCGRNEIRKIVLQMLEILIRTRPVEVKNDSEFHNVLRILHKVLKTSKLDPDELYPVSTILTGITQKYTSARTVPLLSIWRTSELILEYTRKLINEHVNINLRKGETLIKGVVKIIQTYLLILSKFSIGQVSDIIFPLHENDTPIMHSRKYYIDSQIDCIKFMRSVIIPVSWPKLNTTNRELNPDEVNLIVEIVSCIDRCYAASMRIGYKQFSFDLNELDILYPLYLLIHRNNDAQLRSTIRSFIGSYILNEIKSEFGTGKDSLLYDKFHIPAIVEVNHKNAISYSKDPSKYMKTVSYLILNYVAMNHKSSYYNPVRLTKVIKSVDPYNLRLSESTTVSKIYNFLVSSIAGSISSFDNVENYYKKSWNSLKDKPDVSKINEEFCFDPRVFFWASESCDFSLLVRESTIREVIQASKRQGCLHNTVTTIVRNRNFRRKFASLLRNDESMIQVILELLDQKEGNQSKCHLNSEDHISLMKELSGLIVPLLQYTVLQYVNGTNEKSSSERIVKVAGLINISLKKCEHFNVLIDDDFANDFFKFLDRLFGESFLSKPGALITTLTETLTLLIGPRSAHTMKVIKYMNHTILGVMYQHLADYTRSDILCERIAKLMIVYDDIDYPLMHRVEKDLTSMSSSILNWMLSDSRDFHKLSLRVSAKLMLKPQDSSMVACITTGIAHMALVDPKVLESSESHKLLKSIASKITLSYNPLVKLAFKEVGENFCEEFLTEQRPVSPAVSFDSDSSIFEEEQASISRILNRLNEEEDDVRHSGACRIPKSLYASQAIEDQYLDQVDFSSWEQRAYDTTSQSYMHDI